MTSTISNVCANCKNPYNPSELYCAHCGYILPHVVSNEVASTNLIDGQQNRTIDLRWGTGYFHHRARLFLRVVKSDLVIPVPLHSRSVVLGRSVTGAPVDIDLTAFRAAELGVSRRHARIDHLRDTLQVSDLGSSNGTWLNRDKLTEDIPRTLRNRAVLQLGDMVFRVQFA
jgi:pSer/pThr/pTyr-binding forkhead associated (FHA) protein